MEIKLTACIVTYNNDIEKLKKAIRSFLNTNISVKLFIVDNSRFDALKTLVDIDLNNIIYIHNPTNPGFGAAHNLGIEKAKEYSSKYHIILNPDIYFSIGVNEEIIRYMETDPSVGLVMPKILYPNGENQFLCKLLPRPIDLIARRFFPKVKIFNRMIEKYELRDFNYDSIENIPYLSGCFMFCKTDVLSEIGGFDDRFFMYLEDTDLCRRIHLKYKTIFYPKVVVFHYFEKGSYRNYKLLKHHIKSAFNYFNKWGWFFDKERSEFNKNCAKGITNVK
ncbi:glycosyltransferase family 2 protein [Cellulophaga sp. F20128]|uniref:glycosyltransferase family 2 protein n=1 Tax=Cellulophaga sp. F20128 TaxID=2926413 RepID=UPI001FF43E21|nr:glycosyltransferase family 2 protein [Cellulophaga sp. F20128]MCK0158141.1 glycosyltransferase family 2 protein [Cellulophaga sp. F20128]